jgi:hypothetical protein
MSRPLILTLCAALVAASVFSCAKNMESPMASPAPVAAKAAALELEQTGGEADNGGGKDKAGAPAMQRKIIRNGEIAVVVKAYKPAREAIEAMLKKSKGYIANSRTDHSLDQVSSATLTLRVPARGFTPVMKALAHLGVVQSEATTSQDITEKYYDIKARLGTARKLEKRLLELLQTRTDKVADLLQVERELARVREKVESFEGKLRLFDNLVDLCTITLNLTIRQKYTPPKPPTLPEEMGEVLSDSWDSLKQFGRGALLVAVALLPWALPMALAIYILVSIVRRIRRKK